MVQQQQIQGSRRDNKEEQHPEDVDDKSRPVLFWNICLSCHRGFPKLKRLSRHVMLDHGGASTKVHILNRKDLLPFIVVKRCSSSISRSSSNSRSAVDPVPVVQPQNDNDDDEEDNVPLNTLSKSIHRRNNKGETNNKSLDIVNQLRNQHDKSITIINNNTDVKVERAATPESQQQTKNKKFFSSGLKIVLEGLPNHIIRKAGAEAGGGRRNSLGRTRKPQRRPHRVANASIVAAPHNNDDTTSIDNSNLGFQCNVCQKFYSTNSSLRRHKRVKHGIGLGEKALEEWRAKIIKDQETKERVNNNNTNKSKSKSRSGGQGQGQDSPVQGPSATSRRRNLSLRNFSTLTETNSNISSNSKLPAEPAEPTYSSSDEDEFAPVVTTKRSRSKKPKLSPTMNRGNAGAGAGGNKKVLGGSNKNNIVSSGLQHQNVYHCQHCSFKYYKAVSLAGHMRKHHPKEVVEEKLEGSDDTISGSGENGQVEP